MSNDGFCLHYTVLTTEYENELFRYKKGQKKILENVLHNAFKSCNRFCRLSFCFNANFHEFMIRLRSFIGYAPLPTL